MKTIHLTLFLLPKLVVQGCVQKHFEHELECLRVCLDIINVNINLCGLDSKSSNYVYSGLQLP
jgi:hypothetical protein